MKLFFDTETTGLPDRNKNWETDFNDFPRIVQMAWIITDDTGKELDKEVHIIKPKGFEIPEEAVKIHKITTQKAIDEGIDEKVVMKAFAHDVKHCEQLIGHNVYFDTSIIKASLLRLKFDKEAFCEVLHKDKRYDTMMKSLSILGLKKWPKLKELYVELFDEEMQNAHTAMGDVEALMKCYFKLTQ